MNLARNLGFSRAAVVLPRDTDDPTSIDDVIRCIQHAGNLQRSAVLIFRKLIIGRAGNDAKLLARGTPFPRCLLDLFIPQGLASISFGSAHSKGS